ncbi:hypothetical protein [Alcanivorax sp.]|uniref:hypothetical protein n=1 Tax=Alcanivorax sp. TaxID=1872427 RepID=UPI0025C14832|nr:hypothetical protein [Alcanivorax sp.]|tara:strand:+ start:534 stop:941 length:408 start_codon:yes stop_codon:yes gene_type:complete
MSSVLKRQSRAIIATLLAATLMVVSSLLSANTLTMAMSTATDSPMPPSSMTHCHHSADTPNGDMAAGHDMTQMQMNGCEDSDSCQCITLCQITAASDAAFVANAFIPSPPGTDSLITTIHAGIHRLPLRPPSLSV